MPIFEYRCKDCGQQFEKIVLRLSDEISCPACGGKNIEKLLSSFSMSGSGSGSTSRSAGASCGSSRFR